MYLHENFMTLAPDKTAVTTRPDVLELIRRRWSPRAFSAQPVAPETLETLFEAATWAASSGNGQPWRFVYAHRADKVGFEQLFRLLVPANQTWAQHAAVLIVALAQTTLPNGKPNLWATHDVGAATATLLLQATALGVHGHVMGGFDAAKTREALALPDDVLPVTFTAIGYLGSPDQLEEPNRTRELAPRTRKPVSEIAINHKLKEE
jgi:nitroreductase